MKIAYKQRHLNEGGRGTWNKEQNYLKYEKTFES